MPLRLSRFFENFSLLRMRRTHTNALKESEQRLRNVIENAVDGLITINDRGVVESFNPACETLFGYRADEVIGRNITMLMPTPYSTHHDTYLSAYKKTREAKIIGIGREVQGLKKNGDVFPLDLSVSEVRLKNKVIYSGIIRDISERKRAEENLHKLIEQLSESNSELERFAYVASHDLQEPLRMVTSFTDLLLKQYGDKLDADAQRYIHYASSAAQRMNELVSDLLEFARIGREPQARESIDMNNIVRYVIENLQLAIEKTGTQITMDQLPRINANPVRMSQLMQNLIGNAIKYARKDIPPTVRLAAEDKGDAWLFSITDNGIGMKPEYCAQIFLPFKRLHSKEEYPGTGIGLAICKKIVEGLDGKIWATSTLGNGSTFYFSIPKHITIQSGELAA